MDIQHCLHRALAPKNIAVLGASDRVGSLGTILWSSLISGQFQGKVYAVNPKYKYLGDTPCYASLKDIQEPIDLAIVATPPQKLETLLVEIAQKLIRFRKIYSKWHFFSVPGLLVWCYFMYRESLVIPEIADAFYIGAAIGGVIGVIIGLKKHFTILREADKVLANINDLMKQA